MEHLARAVELYHGELLHGYYDNWVVREQERLRDLFLEAARRLIAGLKRANELDRALLYARHAGSVETFVHEAVHRDLIRLLAATGRQDISPEPRPPGHGDAPPD